MTMGVFISKVDAEDAPRVLKDVPFAQARAEAGEGSEGVALEEKWQVLHFALTGEQWKEGVVHTGPLHRAVLGEGGVPVEAVDCGHGPGRLLAAQRVQEVAEALARIPTSVVAQRLLTSTGKTPASMDEAELMIGAEFELFDDLKDLYTDAAEEGASLLFTYT
jgi:hypothetical protein